jgi:hypothetical protein
LRRPDKSQKATTPESWGCGTPGGERRSPRSAPQLEQRRRRCFVHAQHDKAGATRASVGRCPRQRRQRRSLRSRGGGKFRWRKPPCAWGAPESSWHLQPLAILEIGLRGHTKREPKGRLCFSFTVWTSKVSKPRENPHKPH